MAHPSVQIPPLVPAPQPQSTGAITRFPSSVGALALPAVNGNKLDLEELRATCRGMLAALEEERLVASEITIQLSEGARIGILADGSVYRFAIATPLGASVGGPAFLRVRDCEHECIVSRCDGSILELTFTEDAGAVIPWGAELLLGAPWLVTRLRQRVREAFEVGLGTPHLFNLKGALLTLGTGEINVAPMGLAPEYEDTERPLNEAQVEAIETAFRSPLSLIAAPAGTGKTLTLSALVEACYRAGLRTLIAAPSNVAVDTLMLRACERLSSEPGLQQAEVLRVGMGVGPKLRATYGDAVVVDAVAARLRPALAAKITNSQDVVDGLASELAAARQAALSTSSVSSAKISADCESEVRELRRRLSEARTDLREVRRTMRDYMRLLVSHARVVGATLTCTYLDSSISAFDVVIIDEASMAHAPAVFIAAGLARRHVVIAGDPYQLAAPVRSHGPHREWLTRDVFESLGITRAIRDEEHVPYLTQFVEQRRSAEAICELERSVWYGPSLRTAHDVAVRERQRHNVILGTSALCYLDTSSLDPHAYCPWGRTYANDTHAEVIRDIVRYIDSGGELPEVATSAAPIVPAVLVLSHYRGQVHALRRVLEAYRARGVSVRTVHSAQGAEATTCILDLTLSRHQRTNVSSVYTATRPTDDGSRFLVTAISRARSRLIVVGDFEWIRASVNPDSVLGRVYSHLLEHGYEIPLSEIRDSSAQVRLHVVR